MIIEQIEYINEDFKDNLLEQLEGNIFHLTSKKAFERIIKDGFVYHNKDNKLTLNPASENSFGRNRDWVCLFDLRKQNQTIIDETLMKYYFLSPSWFNIYKSEYTESNLAYLFVHPREYNRIIANDTAKKVRIETGKYEHYIPMTECWYPGTMPLSCVEKVLLVRIYKDAPKHNPFRYVLHQFAVEDQKMNSRRGKTNGFEVDNE